MLLSFRLTIINRITLAHLHALAFCDKRASDILGQYDPCEDYIREFRAHMDSTADLLQ